MKFVKDEVPEFIIQEYRDNETGEEIRRFTTTNSPVPDVKDSVFFGEGTLTVDGKGSFDLSPPGEQYVVVDRVFAFHDTEVVHEAEGESEETTTVLISLYVTPADEYDPLSTEE